MIIDRQSAKKYKVDDLGTSLVFTARQPGSVIATGRQMLFPPPGDLVMGWLVLAWVIGWTLAGRNGLKTYRRSAAGTERFEVSADAVRIRRSLFGIGSTHRYEAAYIDNLRVEPGVTASPAGVPGPLVFDYLGQAAYFGGTITQGEAREILALIAERYPDLTKPIT